MNKELRMPCGAVCTQDECNVCNEDYCHNNCCSKMSNNDLNNKILKQAKESLKHLNYAECANSKPSHDLNCLSVLVEQFEKLIVPPNEPLTLEQLKQREGKSVWVEYIKKECGNGYVIIAAIYDDIMFTTDKYEYLFSDYNKVWLAYDHEPERL